MRKSKLSMYRELIRQNKEGEIKLPLPINGAGLEKPMTQEEKDKKRNTTMLKITEKEKQEIKPIQKNKISDEKLKKFINFRL